jgi:hypothetical protein
MKKAIAKSNPMRHVVDMREISLMIGKRIATSELELRCACVAKATNNYCSSYYARVLGADFFFVALRFLR